MKPSEETPIPTCFPCFGLALGESMKMIKAINEFLKQ